MIPPTHVIVCYLRGPGIYLKGVNVPPCKWGVEGDKTTKPQLGNKGLHNPSGIWQSL